MAERVIGSGPAAIKQRFIKTRFGWRVETERVPEEGMGTEPLPFAFTWRGICRKAARERAALITPPPRGIVEYYDEKGRLVPAPRRMSS